MAGDDDADLQSASVQTSLRLFVGQADHVRDLDQVAQFDIRHAPIFHQLLAHNVVASLRFM
jgi:hypothetical protein